MKEITDAKELKSIELGILDYVNQFCVKHGIKYGLGYGTLIGAVRHKGFIPWDDDIDIVMRRDEYDRFVELFSKERGRYKVWSHTIQNNYPLAFAKVTDEYTLKIESYNYNIERGIDIDVFPIDDLPRDEKSIKKQFSHFRNLYNILNLKQIKCKPNRPFYKNLILIIGRLFFCWYPLDKLVNDLSDNAQRYRGCNGRFCAQMVSYVYKEKEIQLKEYSDTYVELEFEGKKYPVQVGYDAYLKQIYGDYMKMPPVEKRVTHHEFKAYWKIQ